MSNVFHYFLELVLLTTNIYPKMSLWDLDDLLLFMGNTNCRSFRVLNIEIFLRIQEEETGKIINKRYLTI